VAGVVGTPTMNAKENNNIDKKVMLHNAPLASGNALFFETVPDANSQKEPKNT